MAKHKTNIIQLQTALLPVMAKMADQLAERNLCRFLLQTVEGVHLLS